MELDGVRADQHAFTTAVEACTDGDLEQYGGEFAGLESDVFVGTTIVNMHGKFSQVDRSLLAFDKIVERNVVAWTAMAAAFAANGDYSAALALLKGMDLDGVKPNGVTYTILLEACAGLGDARRGEDLHCRIEESLCSMSLPETVVSAMIYMHGKCGRVEKAESLFEKMEQRNLILRTSMMAAYAQNGHHRAALRVFQGIDHDGIKHDVVSFVSVLEACSTLPLARRMHSRIIATGVGVGLILGTALVTTYRKCGALGMARSTFDGIGRKGILCWNTMISAYAQHGHALEALKLFNKLKQAGERPNSVTFVSSIAACGHAGRLDDALYNLSSMIRDYKIEPTSEHLGMAEKIVLKEERILQWKALLAACKVHRDFKRGGRIAKKLLELDPGNDVSYVMFFNLYVENQDKII